MFVYGNWIFHINSSLQSFFFLFCKNPLIVLIVYGEETKEKVSNFLRNELELLNKIKSEYKIII